MREGRPSGERRYHRQLLACEREFARERFATYADADQDHLDVAEHLGDAYEDVQQNGHELRETRHNPNTSETLRNPPLSHRSVLTCRREEGTGSSSSDCHTPAGLRRGERGRKAGQRHTDLGFIGK